MFKVGGSLSGEQLLDSDAKVQWQHGVGAAATAVDWFLFVVFFVFLFVRLCVALLTQVLLDSMGNLLLCFYLLLGGFSGLFLFLLLLVVVAGIEECSDWSEGRTSRLIFFLWKPVCVTDLGSIRIRATKTTQAMPISFCIRLSLRKEHFCSAFQMPMTWSLDLLWTRLSLVHQILAGGWHECFLVFLREIMNCIVHSHLFLNSWWSVDDNPICFELVSNDEGESREHGSHSIQAEPHYYYLINFIIV